MDLLGSIGKFFGMGGQPVGGMSLPGTRIDSYGSDTGLRLDYQGSGPAWVPSTGRTYAAPKPAPAPQNWSDDYNRGMANIQAQLNAALAEINRPGKVLGFDPAGALARARQQAEASVSPYYQSLLAKMAEDYNIRRETARGENQREIQGLEMGHKNTLEDVGIGRQRTTEDVTQNLENIANQEEQFQQDTGEQFDAQRDQASAQMAESGLATSGIGAQQIGRMQQQRNTQEGRKEQQFQLQERMQQQFKNRTFEDLALKENRSKEQTEFGKEKATFNLTQALKGWDNEQAQKNMQLEKTRMQDIAERSSQGYQSELGRFLAANANARGKDIEATRAAYGSYA